MKCKNCGSTEILRDAYARWDQETQEWVLHSIYDEALCVCCGTTGWNNIEEDDDDHP